jgi:hypothetical protein
MNIALRRRTLNPAIAGLVAAVTMLFGITIWLHFRAGSGLLSRAATPLGILYDPWDNLSYAAWAEQNRLGLHWMTDLYTTDAHVAILFNPYYALIGWLSHVTSWSIIFVMTLIAFAGPAVVGAAVYWISRRLLLPQKYALLAALLALFGSGPSWLFAALNKLLSVAGSESRVAVGVDLFYYDLFPSTAFICYPYQTASLMLVGVALCVMHKSFDADARLHRLWIVLASFIAALVVLVHPYEGCVLGVVYPLSLACHDRLVWARRHLVKRVTDIALSISLVFPAMLYVVIVSRLPVWSDFSRGSFASPVNGPQLLLGFSVFWFLACAGIFQAIRQGRRDFILLGVWAGLTILAVAILGAGGAKFTNSAVIAYAILAAYGIYRIAPAPTSRVDERHAQRRVLLVALSMVFTFGCNCARIMDVPSFDVDPEIAAIAVQIRQHEGNHFPTVLTDCRTGAILPALAGARVYAGHLMLTPDFSKKCLALAAAGLPVDLASAPPDPAILARLLRDAGPDYAVLRQGSAVAPFLIANYGADRVWAGQRWSLLALPRRP